MKQTKEGWCFFFTFRKKRPDKYSSIYSEYILHVLRNQSRYFIRKLTEICKFRGSPDFREAATQYVACTRDLGKISSPTTRYILSVLKLQRKWDCIKLVKGSIILWMRSWTSDKVDIEKVLAAFHDRVW